MRSKVIVLLTALCIILVPLPAVQSSTSLPSFDLATGSSLNPVLLVDAITGTIQVANTVANQFFGRALEGRNISRILGLEPTQSISSLHGQVLELEDLRNGKPTYQHFSVQGLQAGQRSYYVIMIQKWDAQHQLAARNRMLMIMLFSLLAVLLVILIVLFVIQYRLTSQIKGQHARQQSILELWQRFLDTDERLSSVRDESGRFIFVNTAFEAFFDKQREALIGKTAGEFSTNQFFQMMAEDDRLIFSGSGPLHIQRQYNGRILQIHQFAMTLPEGSAGVGSLITDITEQQENEKSLTENLQRAKQLTEILSSAYTNERGVLERGLELACQLTGSTTALLLGYNQKDRLLTLTNSCPQPMPRTELTRTITQHYLQLLQAGKAIIENEGPFSTPLADALADTLTSLMSVPFYVEDQLGGIVLVANSPIPYDEQDGVQLQLLFSALSTTTEKQAREHQLEESRQSMRLILDSTAEGIFGMDSNGKCTFCNASCLELLGYADEQELLDKEIHRLIHYSRKQGTPLCDKECSIMSTLDNGIGVMAENEVFWRKDGTSFSVLAYSYPQIKDGQVIGAVVTFTDNTDRMETLKHIEYLSRHDQLTGMKNRMSFDEALPEIEAAIPSSIIVGDVNGLKLTNDIFGHTAGDELLQTVAAVMQAHCPAWGSVYRIGGDEFVILLPHSDEEFATDLIQEILNDLEQQELLVGRQTIALGGATRTSTDETINEIFEIAETRMYRQKVLRLRETQQLQLDRLLALLFKKSPSEQHHAEQVRRHALLIGETLGLSKESLSLLGRAAYHHDIGKLTLSEALIRSRGSGRVDQRTYQSHVSVGYRILNAFDETMDLSEYVLHHHEWYNGEGYLKGLQGKEIPYLSRILRIAEIWEREGLDRSDNDRIRAVLTDVSGIEADPDIINRIIASL